MASGKWIGSALGFIFLGGPLGALAGFVLGSLFDAASEPFRPEIDFEGSQSAQQYSPQATQRDAFLFSLLALASYVIRSDGRVMHSEMEFVRQFLRQNFGTAAQQEGEQILLRLFDQQKRMGQQAFRTTIEQCCNQLRRALNQSMRLQLLNFLVLISQADGNVAQEEIAALRFLTAALGLSPQDLDALLHLEKDDLDSAYKVLGIEPSATDDEVKKAYRRLALKHHPDRVATLGDDVKQAAERKFKEINDARDRIYKARGL